MRNVLAIALSFSAVSCLGPVLERACERDADCGSGYRCISLACREAGTTKIGSPCTLDSDCSELGAGALCKRTTSTGSATYPGGYCSLRCSAGAGCPAGTSCVTFSWLGENDPLCLQSCPAASTCRMPGYDCWSTGGAAVCWILSPDGG